MIHRTFLASLALVGLVGAAAAQQGDLVCRNSGGTDDNGTLAALIDGIEPVFQAFPDLRELIAREATDICLSASLYDARGYFSPEDNRIVLQIDLPQPTQVAILIHELRHLQQYTTGSCPTDSLAMSESARATLALEADASAISLFIANTLKDAGQPDIWQALSHWPTHRDIAAAFAAELGASADPRRATTAAFAQWYASEWRRDNYYRASCSSYLDRQDTTKALPQYDQIPPGFYKRLCIMPDGSPYDCVAGDVDPRP
ncbi:DUF6782 family putative metallopeptidase [uncultured Roseovarius sp.]|uniref:DUF6782 family putative metallopeptidase n=1 Tax=Roseovarius sp. TaxID=1486281 RepID=UPI0025D4D68A|nr:DUF6782 family putative metallopeptidase [uncultured Roseovarius sp.]